MTDRDEWAILRRRQDDIRNRLDTLGRAEPQPATRLGQVYSGGSIPTSLPGVFLMHPVRASGNESEGANPSFTVDTGSSFAATVVGRRVPVAGDRLVCQLCSGRWVAQTGQSAGSSHTIPGCACSSTPDVATLTVSGSDPHVHSCTFRYGPSPADYGYGDQWWSDEVFSDGVSDYRQVLTCRLAFYAVDLSYALSSPSAGVVATNYIKWNIGAVGNTCSPLYMSAGVSFYPGASASGATLTS